MLFDNRHLTEQGVRYFCARSREFVLVTSNTAHPAFGVQEDNLHIIDRRGLSLAEVLAALKADYGCRRLTVQTGGTLNGAFLREKLLDFVDIVVAPALVGGRDTPTLIDGDSLLRRDELSAVGTLTLQECTTSGCATG